MGQQIIDACYNLHIFSKIGQFGELIVGNVQHGHRRIEWISRQGRQQIMIDLQFKQGICESGQGRQLIASIIRGFEGWSEGRHRRQRVVLG